MVVVRHGTTAWSRAGRHTGRTDVPLLTDGEQEAELIGRRLQGHSFARVLTSPSSRARDTCALAGFGDQAQVCEDLAEWDYGAYEGLTTAQIRAERPGWQLWIDGVVGGETLEELSRRADKVVARARADAEAGDVLAFAHGHILRVVCARWLGMAAAEASRFLLSPGAVGVLGWEHETAAVVRWNDAGRDPLGA
ncbi:MAG TPA: histidine phosphatase family protein [Acidimicrobiales bacterium]|nr:histidine phosphatase family protein [Acidimicrobiales bacterium]